MTTTVSKATTLFIPTPLRSFTDNKSSIDVPGETIQEVMENLVSKFPDLKQHLFDEQNQLRSFINIYRNDDDIRYLQGLNTAVGLDDTLSIIPSIAGGR